MNKKITAILLSFLITLNISSTVLAANSLDENKGQFNQISNEIKDLDSKISGLDDEIYKIKEKVKSNENEISKVQNEIENTNVKISSLKKELEENENILSDRLREIYKSGSLSSVNTLIYILKADGLGDLFSRIYSAKVIIDFDNELIKKNIEMVDSLNSSISSLESKKSSLDKLNEETKSDLSDVQEKQNSIKDAKNQLNAERSKVSNAIKENEEKLVSHQISIINSSNPTSSQLSEAIMTLKSLLPQISTPSVRDSVNDAINKAQELINKLGQAPTPPKPPTSGDGNYKATFSMEATAYSGHGITAMGTVPVRDPNGLSTVAVDPSVIPLGSKVYIPNYGYAIASDTGSAINGMKIDLYMNSKEECYQFGRKQITVHLIAYPGEW